MNEIVCPSCGHSWPAGTAFCGACANTIPTPALPEAHAVAVVPTDPTPVADSTVGESLGVPTHPSNDRGARPVRPSIPERSEVIVLAPSPEVQPPAASKERRVPSRLILTLVGAVVVCGLGVGSLGVYAAIASGGAGSHPSASASTPVAASDAPGWWKPTPVWSGKGTALAMTSDGLYVAVSVPAGVQIRVAETGKIVDAIKEPGLRIAAVTSAGEHGFLAWTTGEVRVWTPKGATSSPIALASGQSVDVKGDGSPLVTTANNEIAWSVTAAGLVAYSSPSKGSVPVAIVGGAVAWASARQAVLMAGPDGIVTNTIPLVAPDGATKISRWLGVAGGQMLVVWTDGARQILAGTTISGGASPAPTMINPADAAAQLVTSGDTKTGSLGSLLLHLDSSLSPVPMPEFAATAGIGGLFLGTANGETVLMRPDGTKTTVPEGVTPIGVTPAGGLLASTATGTTLFAAK